ncbi:MAG TPA: adenylosuccinate lyase [Acidobacteriota bacterium]
MIPRYSLKEMADLWSEEAKFGSWLKVEIEVCEVLALRGLIPRRDLTKIRQARFSSKRIEQIEKVVDHDVIAFITNVQEGLGPEGRFIHYGLTSYDVVDTALSLRLALAVDLIRGELAALMAALEKQARRYQRTPMVGRTHGVHAEPTSLGLRFALWHAECQRADRRLAAARHAIAVGKLSGAVGNYPHLGPEIEAEVCRRLGLEAAPISTQILQRDRHAELVCALALLATSLEKFATQIRAAQRSEILELEEPFRRGQRGSSSMPHKRNPIVCERICGLARLLRGYAQAALENMVLWEERDISHSGSERVLLPDATILAHYMLRKFSAVIANLHIYPQNMQRNLERLRGLVYSGGLLHALVEAGAARDQAYSWVQRCALRAWEQEADFAALAAADPDIRRHLKGAALQRVFDAGSYLRHVDQVFARVFRSRSQRQVAAATARRRRGAG